MWADPLLLPGGSGLDRFWVLRQGATWTCHRIPAAACGPDRAWEHKPRQKRQHSDDPSGPVLFTGTSGRVSPRSVASYGSERVEASAWRNRSRRKDVRNPMGRVEAGARIAGPQRVDDHPAGAVRSGAGKFTGRTTSNLLVIEPFYWQKSIKHNCE